MAQHAAQDAAFLVAFDVEEFLLRHETLIDEDLKRLLPELFLGGFVLLDVLNGVFHAFNNNIVRGLHLGVEKILLLFHENVEFPRPLLPLKRGDTLFEALRRSGCAGGEVVPGHVGGGKDR